MSVILSYIGDNEKVQSMFPTDAPTADLTTFKPTAC